MTRTLTSLLCALAFAIPSVARAADDAADQAQQKAMQQMMELSKPGKEHAQLAKLAGAWDATVKAYMKPGAPPEESKGSAVYTLINDGRFLRSEFKGQMMGMPFTGTGIDGYDRVRGAYVSTWMDSMSTGLMFETGTSKDEGKTIEYTGEVGDCMAPGKTVTVRSVVTHHSDDAFTFAMYQTRAGEKEAQALEIAYTRAKGK